ncbi:MAG TPA: hypothetical protein VFD41_11010 [Actinomycetales bacterium]|nr:hypothetical protein [Actinomycetales bacterium]
MSQQPGLVPGTQPDLSADAVAAVVGDVPSVRLHEGSAAGTHLPGRRVSGVRMRGRDVEIHAAVVYPTTVEEAAVAVRLALAVLPVGRVDVTIDDVVLPEDDDPTDGPSQGLTPEVPHA